MSVTIGDAILYLSANPDALNADLRKADSKIKKFAKGAQKVLGAALKVGFLAAAAGIAAGIGILAKSVFEAADAGEAMAKFEATFGEAGDGLISTLDELATATGRSKYGLRESAANFGAVTKAMGFTEEGAADMSAAALEMAVDLGAFHNLPTEDVANRIQKALTGETESMKTLGVVINANRIKQELLNMGITDNINEVDEAIKAQAIFNILQRQTTDAVGVAAAEAGTFTGQVTALKAGWKDFMVDAGTQLLPMLTEMLTNFTSFAKDVLPLVVTWVGEKLVPALVTFATFVETTVLPALQTFGAWITDTLIPTLTTLWEWFEINILPVLTAVADVVSALLVGAFDSLKAVWEDLNPLLETFFGWIEGLLEPIGGMSGAVEALVGWLHDLADAIRSQPEPDRWWNPNSPTPFEVGLRGMADALKKELTPQLGKFALQLAATGGAGLGAQTTNLDQSRTTRVDQMTINNGRDEQGVLALMRNWSRT